jgi:putative ABC transport system permease protein
LPWEDAVESLFADIRFGLRSLKSAPATTAIALLALALGIGANTAIFSVVNGVLLKPLPYPQPERLVILSSSNPKAGFPRFSLSPPDFDDLRGQNRSFEGLAALAMGSVNLTGRGEPEVLDGAQVSADFFPVLRLRPFLGRTFRPDEDTVANHHVVLLSHGLWQRRFGADPKVVGQSLLLDGESYTVVGVAPPGFDFPRKRDLWVPLTRNPAKESRGAHFLTSVARLRPGVPVGQAQSELRGIAARLAKQYPESNDGWTILVLPLQQVTVEKIRPALLVLLWVVAAVLLIACLNVANLLLARLAARGREISIRTALGAGRGRLVRQLLTESVLLSLLGGALGLLLAYWGTRALVALNPAAIPHAEAIGLDSRVLGFTLALSVLAGLFFGLFPALHDPGAGLHESLKEGGRAMSGGRRGRFARQFLALAEVAIALVLLVMAGVLLRSFSRLSAVDPGFRPAGVLTLDLSPSETKYPDPGRLALFYRDLLGRVSALPGVERAATVFPLPLSGKNFFLGFSVFGRPTSNANPESATVRRVSPEFFRTLGVRLIRGRVFDGRDAMEAPKVALVNEKMAASIWPHGDPLGQRLTFDDPEKPGVTWMTVVGVVGDVKQQALSDEPSFEVYEPQLQDPAAATTLVVRSGGDPTALVASIRRAVLGLDPDLPVYRVRTLVEVVDESLAQNRLSTVLLGLFAGLALVLAAVGVYGVISYSVAQRTHEMGIRMALGAHRADVLRLVIRQGMGLVGVGLALGLLGAWFATRVLSGLVFGVSTKDPMTFVLVPALLASVALLANYVPARRATQVDPQVALRQE